ncbi:MAG: glycosyltransferase [Prevotella sp.]|nr:glycosyltransferase [Prevotella sp.]
MNILFEFITVSKKTGAGEYHRRVFYAMMDKIRKENSNINVYCLYDSSLGIAYEDLKPDVLQKEFGVTFLDMHQHSLSSLVSNYKIDNFFIACSHYLAFNKQIGDIRCPCICVIHDLCDQEFSDSLLGITIQLEKPDYQFDTNTDGGWKVYYKMNAPTMKFVRWFLGLRRRNKKDCRKENILALFKNNPQTKIVTVSEYTRNSVNYYLGVDKKKIDVLYSPERVYTDTSDKIENATLRDIISNKKKYYFFPGAGRGGKNPQKMIRVFRKFAEQNPECYLVTTGYPTKRFENHIPLSFLSDSDLSNAYKHCYAFLYPSYFEGFGYPPLEAMRYGKPIIASNVTSIPEILGDAAVFCSPFYASDIYRALNMLECNYHHYVSLAIKRFTEIHNRQESDLNKLINKILYKV